MGFKRCALATTFCQHTLVRSHHTACACCSRLLHIIGSVILPQEFTAGVDVFLAATGDATATADKPYKQIAFNAGVQMARAVMAARAADGSRAVLSDVGLINSAQVNATHHGTSVHLTCRPSSHTSMRTLVPSMPCFALAVSSWRHTVRHRDGCRRTGHMAAGLRARGDEVVGAKQCFL